MSNQDNCGVILEDTPDCNGNQPCHNLPITSKKM